MDAVSYHEPATVDEAARILARDPEARCLAGGQTLVAGMNTGLVRPSALVSLRRIEELKAIQREPDGTVTVGAMASHQVVARDACFAGGLALVRDAARQIAHPGVRGSGTIGGAVFPADPRAGDTGGRVA